jgi:hypothetical protein
MTCVKTQEENYLKEFPVALLTAQQIGSPSTPTYTAASASDTVIADAGGLILHVKGGAGSDTITLTDPGLTPSGSTATNPSFVLPATTGDRMYRLTPSLQNSSNIITIAHSAPTGVTVAVFRA